MLVRARVNLSYIFVLLVLASLLRFIAAVPSKRNLVQPLTTPLVDSATINKVGAWPIRLDGPPWCHHSDTSYYSVHETS